MKQRGFTLLEVMIAVFVLAVGMLALAHLQTTGLKTNQSAKFRSQASMVASNILDRVRANADVSADGDYNIELDDSPNVDQDGSCVNASIADADICAVLTSLEDTLPGGDASINCGDLSPQGATLCDIEIRWFEMQDDGSLNNTSFVFTGAI